MVQTYLARKVAEKLSGQLHASITVKGVSIAFFNKIVLEDVLVKDQNNDSLLFVHDLTANIDSFSIKKRFVSINKLSLDKTYLNIKSDTAGIHNYQFLADAFQSTDSIKKDTLSFNFILNSFDFDDARIKYAYPDSSGMNEIEMENISLGISDLKIQEQNLAFQINKLQMENQYDFRLDEFTALFSMTSDSVFLNSLHLHTSNSEITDANISLDKSRIGKEFDLNKLKINLDLKKSRVSLKDISLLVPSMKGMEEDIEVSGKIFGTLTDLKGNEIELSMGENTKLDFNFYLNGLPDFANTYMHFDLKKSFADFNDLSKLKLPDNFPLDQIRIPANLLDAGIVEYNGNFTGFLSDFVAFGTFRSKWGVLNTDLSFVPVGGEKLKMKGRLKTVNFQLGKLFRTDVLGRITFNGDITGLLNQQTNNFSARVSGQIDSTMINDYQYHNIGLKGEIINKRFDGSLLVNDPNLKFRFDGKFDLNVPVPEFNFDMLVDKADLKALKLDHAFSKSQISFALGANFSGNNIDNLAGAIHFKQGVYENENGQVEFNDFDLKTFFENEPVMEVRSDFLDADIRGQYELHKLPHAIKKIINKYIPSSGLTVEKSDEKNIFDFRLNLKDLNRFTQVLIPDLRMGPAKLEGSINSEKGTLILNAKFPDIQYKSTVLKDLSLNVDGDSKLNVRNKIDEIRIGTDFKIYNLSLNSEASGDLLDSRLDWNNFGDVSYSGSVNTSTRFFPQKNYPHVEVSVKPTRLYLADSLWRLNPAMISIDSTLIRVNNLKLSNKNQSILADGSIDKNQENKLNVYFNQIDLSSLNNIVTDGLDLQGELNGSLSVLDFYKRALFLSDLKISGLALLGQSIGEASIQSRLDTTNEEIVAELLVESGSKQTLLAYGIYNPEKDSISVDASFDHFSLLILQPLMGSSFANFHGDATGKVRIYGSPSHIQHDGALHAANAGLMLSELQVNYNLNDSVRFSGDKIIFPDMRVTDDFGNSGIFTGTIKHQSFSKMTYDLTVKTNRILAINTTSQINEQFYGKLYGSGSVRITGKGAQVLIDGIARTEKGTDMNIMLDYEEEAQEYNFLTFVSRGYQPKIKVVEAPVSQSDLQMRFDIEITPEARAQLIYNSKIGDVIRSQGYGNMMVSIDNNNNISLFGEYTVEQGDYLFTLQNVINKKFEIQQGGTIEWNGDPMEAVVDLNAIYRLKASLNELFGRNEYTYDTQNGTGSTSENRDLSLRLPVSCKIALSKSLNNPDIKFDIELPTAIDRLKDEVRQYISSDEDMNKQILSLLVLGKFYTPEYLRGSYTAGNTNLVGTTASELLSNQFSNWLSQISNDFDIGVNYRPGNQITNDEIELALSTQMFNDRVTINGNIGNNASQRTTNNNSGLVGDADINVKITNNGKLQLKAYNHSNNNLIYDTSPYTQGVGVSYREDFNDLNELLKKLKTFFKKRKTNPDKTVNGK
ncbi:MAG: translocation/assembly module TamB domain-containing protein [Prolixibacteraceae bacterium]